MNVNKVASEVYQLEKNSAFSENDIHEAVRQLRPNYVFFDISYDGNYNFNTFKDSSGLGPPTTEEINNQLKYQKEVAEYYQYAYDRCKDYPDGFEQFDMLWHAINNEENLKTSKWFLKIKEIKEKYPKPNINPPIKEK